MTSLANLTVLVDLPDGAVAGDAEAWVAQAVANYFAGLGYPGNASVTLNSLTPNITVIDPTPPADAPPADAPPAS